MLTRDDCRRLDREDPLATLRGEFELPDGILYLDGNSLGPLPRAARARALQVLEREWAQGLIRSWNEAGWFALPARLGDRLAPLLGANPGEVVVTDSTSVNLFKVLAAALRLRGDRKAIVSERDGFPTDLYITQGLAGFLGQGHELRLVDDADELPQALGEDAAVLLLNHVHYRTGAMHDMAAMTARAHACGALMVWDLAHSVGAVPVDLNGARADFAVGSTYKYLNAGPGAPAFLLVSARHQAAAVQPLSGWWGHAAPFAMRSGFQPAPGIARFLCGTQPILSLVLVECGLEVFERTDMAAVRAKSLALSDLFIQLVEARCAGRGLELVTPRAHARRGSQVSLRHEHGYPIMQALIARGVIGDYREPHILRFGFAPLYVRYVDVWDAVEQLRDILDSDAWRAPAFQARRAVT
jgi:kynureninase